MWINADSVLQRWTVPFRPSAVFGARFSVAGSARLVRDGTPSSGAESDGVRSSPEGHSMASGTHRFAPGCVWTGSRAPVGFQFLKVLPSIDARCPRCLISARLSMKTNPGVTLLERGKDMIREEPLHTKSVAGRT